MIGVVSVGRSDFGILRPVLQALRGCDSLKTWLYAGGMHLESRFGSTWRKLESEGFTIRHRVPMGLSSDRPLNIALAFGKGVAGFARAFARSRPDLLLLTGDSFEMYSAGVAAVLLGIPIAHLHGGELSLGAVDDALRHSLTKLSQWHFVASEDARDRVIQMGESPDRVFLCGAPSLDNLASTKLLDIGDLELEIGFPLSAGPVLVTLHPETVRGPDGGLDVAQVLGALEAVDRAILFTGTNADAGGTAIRRAIRRFAARRRSARFVEDLGTGAYFSLMKWSSVMVGNSSSGILEAPSFGLPVVNVGSRQDGRLRGENVIDVPCSRPRIAAAIRTALSSRFRARCLAARNPYDRGGASAIIIHHLAHLSLGGNCVRKEFWDIPGDATQVVRERRVKVSGG